VFAMPSRYGTGELYGLDFSALPLDEIKIVEEAAK
jgi:hypothetical protein